LKLYNTVRFVSRSINIAIPNCLIPSCTKRFLLSQWTRSSQPWGSNESVRVHQGKYLDTLLLLKLTITPFASVGYHGGRWSTLEVRPHYTWLLTRTHTHVHAHTHTHTHTHARDSTGRRRHRKRRNDVRGHVYGTFARSDTHPSSATFPGELMSSHAP